MTRFNAWPVTLILAVCLMSACGQTDNDQSRSMAADSGADPAPAIAEPEPEPGSRTPASGADDVIEVVGREYAFEAPDELPSGWNTIRLVNEGNQAHFLLMYRLPEGKTQEHVLAEVVPVYDRVMKALQDGETDKAGAFQVLGSDLPPWFFQATFSGGPGLVAPGAAAQATVKLQPGRYIFECYVKGPDGRFHSSMGMQKEVRVTQAGSGRSEPEAAIGITLSNDGIETDGELVAGRHTIRVTFAEDPPGGFPYDVHLARLEEDTDVQALRRWMDWMNVGGMRVPAPAEFVGGLENQSAGTVGYFTIDLAPGRYAWLSEVGAEREMYKEFVVE